MRSLFRRYSDRYPIAIGIANRSPVPVPVPEYLWRADLSALLSLPVTTFTSVRPNGSVVSACAR